MRSSSFPVDRIKPLDARPATDSMVFTRRHLLMTALAATTSRTSRAAKSDPPLFEEIPPETSGIKWVHDNASSELHYLPETMGPGCAFLDYDNDGWMDIFLVNSGPSDFYTPKNTIPNA